MKIYKKILIFIFCIFFPLSLYAESTEKIDTNWYTITTKHFTFIYQEKAKETAQYLASIGENLYAMISYELDTNVSLHLPVTIISDSDKLNGYYSPLPVPRIVLYQAPMSPNSGFARYNDTLKKLFLHELTHAISLKLDDNIPKYISSIFVESGAPLWNVFVPQNFIEGVTVSFESKDGFGRASQTAYAAYIQQDIIENNFKSFKDSNGLYNDSIQGVYYIYGGWFSKYLQETYGNEVYSDIWKRLSNCESLYPSLFSQGIIAETTGFSFDSVWSDFKLWMTIKEPVATNLHILDKDYHRYYAITELNGLIYVADENGIWEYNPISNERKKLLSSDNYVNQLSFSNDGKKLLISTAQIQNDFPVNQLIEYDMYEKSRRTLPFGNHLSEACYFKKDIIALKPSKYSFDIVLINDSQEEQLFKGDNNNIPGLPLLFDDDTIIFILQKNGVNYLAKLSISTKSITVLHSDYDFTGLKNIFIKDKKICFIFDNDLTMFKLGIIENDVITFQETPISGGIQFPIFVDSNIYYISSLSRGMKLACFPENGIKMNTTTCDWVSLVSEENTNEDPLVNLNEKYSTKNYNPLAWLLWPQIRIPTISIGFNGNSYLSGLGIFTMSVDPIGAITLQNSIGYNWNESLITFDTSLNFKLSGVLLAINAFDLLNYSTSTFTPYRTSGLLLSVSNQIFGQPYFNSLFFSISSGIFGFSAGENNSVAYSWKYESLLVPIKATIGLKSFSKTLIDDSLEGIHISLSYTGIMDAFLFTYPEGILTLNTLCVVPFFNVSFMFDGSIFCAAHPDVVLSSSGVKSNTNNISNINSEYNPIKGYNSFIVSPDYWALQGEINTSLTVPVNRILNNDISISSITFLGGSKGMWLGGIDGIYLSSIFARSTLDIRFGMGTTSSFPIAIIGVECGLYPEAQNQPYVEFYFKRLF